MCEICNFFVGIDIYSVQYLGWITAISVTIIALTTIIFSQYNERSIEKSNDLSERIKSSLLSYNDSSVTNDSLIHSIRADFNKMVYVLSNNSVYKQTLLLFKCVVYSFSVLWTIGSIGYALDAGTVIDKIIIITSTFVLISIFIFLPDVLKNFNSSYPVILDEKNRFCDLNTGISYLKENNNLSSPIIIKDIIMPSLKVKLINGQIELRYNQSLNLSNYKVVYVLKSSTEAIFLSLILKRDTPSIRFVDNLKESISYVGLVKSIREANKAGVLYISDFSNNTYAFNFKKEVNEEGIFFVIGNKVEKKNSTVEELFLKGNSLIQYETSEDTLIYDLTHKEI